MNKKGETEHLVETWHVVVGFILLVLLVAGVILLLKGKGGEALEAFRNFLRFGGN